MSGNKYRYIFLFLVCLKALSYWLISWWQHYGAPLSSIVMYRVGDINYYPLISGLSRFNFGETMLFELKGTGISSFPFGAIFIHSLFYRFFNLFGFILVDVLVAIVYYMTLVALLKLLKISSILRGVASLLVVSRAVGYGSGLHFWGWRIPRPFITELFLLLCLYFILSLIYSQKRIKGIQSWIFLGISTAALLQSDLYSLIMIAICIFLLLLYTLVRYRNLRTYIIRGSSIFFIATVICSIPFLFQRLFENPDVPRRLGLFPIDRTKPFFLDFLSYGFRFLVVFLFGLMLIKLFQHFYKRRDKSYKIIGVYFLWFMCVIAYIALPISCILLGKGIQLYHFDELMQKMFVITIYIFCLYVFDLIVTIFSNKARQLKLSRTLNNGFEKSIIVVVVFCSILYTAKTAYYLSGKNTHMRSDFIEWRSLTNYRTDFVALIKKLSKKDYADCKVIGTFDHQLCSWWTSFKQGYSFLGDPFVTTASDDEIESRLIVLCKIIGMDPEDFQSFFNRHYVNHFWLGHNKYQASGAYTFAPIWDYGERDQKVIREETNLNNWRRTWHLAIPKSEQRRLVNQYNIESIKDNIPKLDLIVLTNDESLKGFMPPQDMFVLSYTNSTFKVWKLR